MVALQGGQAGPRKYPFPFHVKLIALLVIWYRYNVNDFEEVIAFVRNTIFEAIDMVGIIYRWVLHMVVTCLPFVFAKPSVKLSKSRSMISLTTKVKNKQGKQRKRRAHSRKRKTD